MRKIYLFIVSLMLFILPGCSANHLDFYKNREPKMDFRAFFNGEIKGHGAFFDFRGRQTSSFQLTIKCNWVGDSLTMKEWFVFDDGHKLERQWEIIFKDGQVIKGIASDVIGPTKGRQLGSAINLNYVLQIPYQGKSINLTMDDWMYALDKNTILNRTAMHKFGFKVGEMILFLTK